MNKYSVVLLFSLMGIVLFGCSCESENNQGHGSKPQVEKPVVEPPVFNADSAYVYVQAQVGFGPRVPGTAEHQECGDFLEMKLKEFGAEVINQTSKVQLYDGSAVPMRNIIGQFQPEKEKRVLLFAHWDTRPWADKDSLEENIMKPIDGANDGASGVGVLLEIARLISKTPPDTGVDIIFFDVEDSGTPEFWNGEQLRDTWCLGSQYWSQNPHKKGYKAKYGILLDMVGGKDAKFAKEGTSVQYASHVMRWIFQSARKTGNDGFFDSRITNPTTDDHLYVNELARIPSAAIVEFYNNVQTMGFGSYGFYHHTHKDNMDIIDSETLKAVGETVMYTIYNK